MQEYGPFKFPDPNPSGYGGPKSTTPAPKPVAAVTGTVSHALRKVPTPVAIPAAAVGGRSFNVARAHVVS